jgi:hypothetical protein
MAFTTFFFLNWSQIASCEVMWHCVFGTQVSLSGCWASCRLAWCWDWRYWSHQCTQGGPSGHGSIKTALNQVSCTRHHLLIISHVETVALTLLWFLWYFDRIKHLSCNADDLPPVFRHQLGLRHYLDVLSYDCRYQYS